MAKNKLAVAGKAARKGTRKLHRQSLFRGCDRIIPVQAGNKGSTDFGRANGLAFIVIPAVTEAEFIHFSNHMEGSAVAFGLALRQ